MPHHAFRSQVTGCVSFVCLYLLMLAFTACGGMPGSLASNLTNFSSQITGVVSGYVWDTVSPGVRPIRGLPGGAQFGTAVYDSGAYATGVVSSRGGYVLLTDTTGKLSFANLPSGPSQVLSGGLSAKQRVVLSPTGMSAALFVSGQSSALLINNLPGAPQAQAVSLPTAATELAVSDAGTLLIASSNADGSVAISSVSGQGAVHGITRLAQLGDMRFVGKGNGALLADSAKNQVGWVQDVTMSSSPQIIASAANGVNAPIGVAASYDGQWAVIANPNGTILRVSLTATSPMSVVVCSCTPDRLVALSGNATFQITASGPGPMWLYQGDLSAPRTIFVPAIFSPDTALRSAASGGR